MFRLTREHRGARVVGVERDHIAKARAYAFDDMYRNYANLLINHYLTPEDVEDVRQVVRPKMTAHLRGVDFEWSYLDRIVQVGIEQAAIAFLSI
jgi:hypothetical protein